MVNFCLQPDASRLRCLSSDLIFVGLQRMEEWTRDVADGHSHGVHLLLKNWIVFHSDVVRGLHGSNRHRPQLASNAFYTESGQCLGQRRAVGSGGGIPDRKSANSDSDGGTQTKYLMAVTNLQLITWAVVTVPVAMMQNIAAELNETDLLLVGCAGSVVALVLRSVRFSEILQQIVALPATSWQAPSPKTPHRCDAPTIWWT